MKLYRITRRIKNLKHHPLDEFVVADALKQVSEYVKPDIQSGLMTVRVQTEVPVSTILSNRKEGR